MGNTRNLAVFSLLFVFLAVLGFLLWSNEVRVLEPDSSPGASERVAGSNEWTGPDAAESLGERGSTAQDEEAARSVVEAPKPAIAPNSILLSGRLVDEGQRPIADHAINFRPHMHLDVANIREMIKNQGGLANDAETIEAVTDGEGIFSIRIQKNEKGNLMLPAEANALFAKTEGVAMQIAGYTKDADLGDLSLIPGAVLAGKVVDSSGQPVAGVSVNLGAAGRFGQNAGGNSETTDALGKFEFRSLRPGDHMISTTAPGYIPSSQKLELAKGEQRSDMTLQLEHGASISGVVLDDEGKPIVGAKVASYRKRDLGSFSINRFDDREAVETDQNGYFALAGIEAESVVLRAFAEGYGDEQIEGVQVGAASVTFRLPRHGSISGVLVDGRGDPIAGSRVWIKKDRGIAGLELFEDLAETKSAEDGSFVIEGAPAGDLLVTADGDSHRPVEPMSVALRPGGQASNLRLVAETGAVIDVLVLDDRGEPIEGVEVKVSAFQEGGQSFGGGGGTFVTRSIRATSGPGGGDFTVLGGDGGVFGKGTTDAAGRVRIAGLPVAAVRLDAEHETMISPAGSRVELDAIQILEHQLVMKPGGFILIESIEANGDMRPETPYELEGPLVAGQESKKEIGQTNGEGLSTMGPLPAGTYRLAISLDSSTHFSPGGGASVSFSDGSANTLEASEQTLVVRPGETTEVSLVRPILTHLVGILNDATGPVTSARVSLSQGDDPSIGNVGHGGLHATTDRDGRFSIDDIQSGTYTLKYGRENALVMHEQELVIPPAQAEMSRDLMLTGGSLRVLVLDDQDGLPIERAKVSVRKPGSSSSPRGTRTMNVMMVRSSVGGGGSDTSITMGGGLSTVMTDEDGVALLEDLPPGEYVLEIKHQRFADQSVEKVKVTDGRITDQGSVQMSPAGFIRGTVTGFGESGGMNLAMVRIKQIGSDDEPDRQPAMHGNFSFDGLRPGLYELSARRLGPGSSDEWGPTQIVEVIAGKRARPQLRLPEGR